MPAAYRLTMEQVVYRFVPCDEEGSPRENSLYTTITTDHLHVGSRIDAALFGYTTWEVVEVRSESGPLLGARLTFQRCVAAAVPLIGDAQEIVTYCHSGSRSALATLALRSTGYNARNYAGSWHEWSRHPELPVA